LIAFAFLGYELKHHSIGIKMKTLCSGRFGAELQKAAKIGHFIGAGLVRSAPESDISYSIFLENFFVGVFTQIVGRLFIDP
jgi:hypothetical protein